MTTERKEQILKSGKFSSVTQHEAVEWINDMNENLSTKSLGCGSLPCMSCSIERRVSVLYCNRFVIEKLTKIHNLSGLNNGIKFGI